MNSARIPPLADDEADPGQAELLAGATRPGQSPFNIFRTLARTPDAMRGFMAWGGYLLSKRNSLPARERELVILRTGYLCAAGYEWAQHVVIGRRFGLTDDEIERIKDGPDAPGWSDLDAALLRATDELVGDHFVTDATWETLAPFGDEQRMNLVYTVGQYTQVSMILNTFGVQLDDGLVLDEDLRR